MAPAAPQAPEPAPPASARPIAAGADPTALAQAFIAALGTPPGAIKDLSPSTMDRAGQLFRRLVAGLVIMVEARARAKSQMGAEATAFEFEGNNPIKFARSPEEAIATLLNPQQRGFMTAERAVEDAYFDLQSHQMATLKAMQGALRATLDRFSPTAIRQRAEGAGVMARILPGARDAALWQAYEKEFGGVAQGSDEAFMDVFAKEFRRAYEEQAAQARARRRS
jgi:type VI secretion system FHA domain protein